MHDDVSAAVHQKRTPHRISPEIVMRELAESGFKPAGNDESLFPKDFSDHVTIHSHRAIRPAAGDAFRCVRIVGPSFLQRRVVCHIESSAPAVTPKKRRATQKSIVEQCQIFTPTPGTISTAMYATGLDPTTLEPVYVEKKPRRKEMQKALILYHLPESRKLIAEALAEK